MPATFLDFARKALFDALAERVSTGRTETYQTRITGPISASSTQPTPLLCLPYRVELVSAILLIPEYDELDVGNTGVILPSSTDKWTFRLTRYRGTQELDEPVDPDNGTNPGDITQKSTGVNGIQARFGYLLTQQNLDAENRVIGTREMLGINWAKTGNPPNLRGLLVTVLARRV